MDLDRPYAGRFAGGEHRFALRVYYEDTDAGGVVYHANYLRYFERARTDMMALAGIDIHAAATAGEGGYVVAEVQLRYLAPARLGDVLVIASRVIEVGSASSTIQQRVIRDGQVISDGRVVVVFVGPSGRPRRQPEHWIAALGALTGTDAR